MSEKTKLFNEYIVVVTSLKSDVKAEKVLELYRYRWQVELYFKRLKSILDYGELPKKKEESVFAWLNGKLMIALLIEKISESLAIAISRLQVEKRKNRYLQMTKILS